MNRIKAGSKAPRWEQWEVSAAIRDAVGLDAEHKAFLWNITSHKKMVEFSTREHLLQRTGLTDFKFRKVVRFLREQRLIDAEKTPGSTTRYSIRMPALKALADPGNPLAENAKQGRRQPPFPASSVTVAPPGRSTKNTRVGNRHAGRVEGQHRKTEPEDVTEELHKNRRTVTVRRPRRSAWNAQDDLDIFD